MRVRALAFVIALTFGDYLLWQWSISGGHDILSLLAGFTLLPLVAVSVGRCALLAPRVLSLLVRRPAASARATRAAREVEATRGAAQDQPAESDSTSGRLAA